MTSIHIVNDENRAGYEAILDEYFRLRHEIFVGERGWRDLERSDGRDMDAYDNEQATYLIALDNGRVVGV
jgi:acyl-homoserine lactone synthase